MKRICKNCGKEYNVNETIKHFMPIPKGFCCSNCAYDYSLKQAEQSAIRIKNGQATFCPKCSRYLRLNRFSGTFICLYCNWESALSEQELTKITELKETK